MAYLPSALSSVRQVVQDYLRSADHLIASLVNDGIPLTEREREMVETCLKDLSKLVVPTPSR
ncbi:protein of unknown function [Nitrospira japonica]|uniref:Uncharacterized protein n=1 Tax=Nitrospira japonica TaxID=1325564 RepID=A0A1W1I1D7_9BACT|nr:hypothetical protein [Nitrospira japonica]SLM46815.1 protein of unknown function [Nitrospira japonica]